MKAAATARTRWAWRRTGRTAGGTPGRSIARVSTFALIVLAAAVIGCAAIGRDATRRDDNRRQAGQHAALHAALAEFQPAGGGAGRFDADEIGRIERRAGVADLRFDTDLIAGADREAQSIQDAQGRIVGWLSWAPDRALIRAMDTAMGTSWARSASRSCARRGPCLAVRRVSLARRWLRSKPGHYQDR